MRVVIEVKNGVATTRNRSDGSGQVAPKPGTDETRCRNTIASYAARRVRDDGGRQGLHADPDHAPWALEGPENGADVHPTCDGVQRQPDRRARG